MSHWDFRVARELTDDDEETFTIREMHYDEAGAVVGWSEKPVSAFSDTKRGLVIDLERMPSAFTTRDSPSPELLGRTVPVN